MNFKYGDDFRNFFKFAVFFENGDQVVEHLTKCGYMKEFLFNNNFILKKCTQCAIKYPKILADFIVGDAWGFVKNKSLMDKIGFDGKRLTFCLCMTEKAERIINDGRLNAEKSRLDVKQALSVCLKHNTSLFKHR